jgi:hypothetical protein
MQIKQRKLNICTWIDNIITRTQLDLFLYDGMFLLNLIVTIPSVVWIFSSGKLILCRLSPFHLWCRVGRFFPFGPSQDAARLILKIQIDLI